MCVYECVYVYMCMYVCGVCECVFVLMCVSDHLSVISLGCWTEQLMEDQLTA